MKRRARFRALAIPLALLATVSLSAHQAATGPSGIRNFTPVDATVACAGALTPDTARAVKQGGFASIVNLRTAEEEGANLEAMKGAAAEAGLRYFHAPLSAADPQFESVDQFLAIARDKRNEPMLINCATGGRAAMLLAIKRVMIDGWSVERAMSEVPALTDGMRPSVRAFGMDYLKKHGKAAGF